MTCNYYDSPPTNRTNTVEMKVLMRCLLRLSALLVQIRPGASSREDALEYRMSVSPKHYWQIFHCLFFGHWVQKLVDLVSPKLVLWVYIPGTCVFPV